MGEVINLPFVKHEDRPEYILSRVERIIVALALANLTLDGLSYTVTKLQWDMLVEYLQKLTLSDDPRLLGKDISFIVYRGMPIRQRLT